MFFLFALNGVALSSVIPPSAALLADVTAPEQRSKVYGAQMAVAATAGLVASFAVSTIRITTRQTAHRHTTPRQTPQQHSSATVQ